MVIDRLPARLPQARAALVRYNDLARTSDATSPLFDTRVIKLSASLAATADGTLLRRAMARITSRSCEYRATMVLARSTRTRLDGFVNTAMLSTYRNTELSRSGWSRLRVSRTAIAPRLACLLMLRERRPLTNQAFPW